jgi:hypothetical protein
VLQKAIQGGCDAVTGVGSLSVVPCFVSKARLLVSPATITCSVLTMDSSELYHVKQQFILGILDVLILVLLYPNYYY